MLQIQMDNSTYGDRALVSSDGEAYASYQLTNFIDDAVRHIFPSPVDNSIIFFADHQGNRKLSNLQD
jgi:hypothetical protein